MSNDRRPTTYDPRNGTNGFHEETGLNDSLAVGRGTLDTGRSTSAVPFMDLSREYEEIGAQIEAVIRRVIQNGRFVLGRELQKFELAFADYLGASHCIGVASGTDALYLALEAAGIGPGDEVITVSHTFIATALAISRLGATPVFVDIDPVTYTMNVEEASRAVTKKTKAILPVHLYGQCVDMDPLLALAREHDLWVVEDACQAVSSTYKGRKAGTMGDFGCFSFYPSKNLGCYGDGGAIITNNVESAEKLKWIRNYGQRERYRHDFKGMNSRLDEIQAAILNVKLPYLDLWTIKRRALANRYAEALKNSPIQLPVENLYCEHVYHLYVIQALERDALQTHLSEKGIQTLIHYPVPVHLQPAFADLGYRPGSLPVTEDAAAKILSLPMYPQLTEAEIKIVSATLAEYACAPASVKALERTANES